MNSQKAMNGLVEIASRIKEMREIMGWSIADMAQKTEVSEEQYSLFESGAADIPFTFIHRRYYIKNNITCFIPSISLYRLIDSFLFNNSIN